MRPAATLRLHDSHACAVAWRPDGSLLSAGLDGQLRILAADGSPRSAGQPQGKGLVSLAVDPDGSARAVTGDLEGALALWDLATGEAAPPVQGHQATAYGLVWTHQGLISAGADGVVQSWKRPSPRLEPAEIRGASTPGLRTRWLASDPCGAVLVAAGEGGPVRVWTRGELVEWGDLGRAVAGAAVHPGAEAVALVSFAGYLEVRGLPDGMVLTRSPPEYSQAVCPLAYSPDGTRLAVGGEGRVRVLDATSLQVLQEDRFPGESPGLAFDGAGTRLAVASTDGRVRVYRL